MSYSRITLVLLKNILKSFLFLLLLSFICPQDHQFLFRINSSYRCCLLISFSFPKCQWTFSSNFYWLLKWGDQTGATYSTLAVIEAVPTTEHLPHALKGSNDTDLLIFYHYYHHHQHHHQQHLHLLHQVTSATLPGKVYNGSIILSALPTLPPLPLPQVVRNPPHHILCRRHWHYSPGAWDGLRLIRD